MDVRDDPFFWIDDRDRQTVGDFNGQRGIFLVAPKSIAFRFIDRRTTDSRAVDLMTTRQSGRTHEVANALVDPSVEVDRGVEKFESARHAGRNDDAADRSML